MYHEHEFGRPAWLNMEPHSLFINHGKLWIGAKIQMNIFQIFHSLKCWWNDESTARQKNMCTLQFVGDDGHTKVQKFSIGRYIFLYDIPVIAQESYTSLRMLLMIFHTWKIHYCSIPQDFSNARREEKLKDEETQLWNQKLRKRRCDIEVLVQIFVKTGLLSWWSVWSASRVIVSISRE